ncbi:MAG: hypothetical protein OJF49_002898 [Ktedonobacterales bacterium]|jgi:predicted Rossmann fold nucleotide-binding protein DprA/Smf involved in DNA uptake|nr:MAG: hypothetical protein OJF49_002898 [Ktedonobacterales bacterium]
MTAPRQQVRITPDSPLYPAGVRSAFTTLPTLIAIGDPAILLRPSLAFLCSVRCPGSIILAAYDLAIALRDAGIPVIGGFHSPMERECLRLLLRGSQPVILCPARDIARMRLPAAWRAPIEQGRLLILSPFDNAPRLTAATALTRNRFAAALATAVFAAYASPGGKIEALTSEIVTWGKPLFTLEDDHNASLLALGARPVRPAGVATLWPLVV